MARIGAWCGLLHIFAGALLGEAQQFDAVAAVQASLQVRGHAGVEAELDMSSELYQQALRHSRLGRILNATNASAHAKRSYNCTKSPNMCKAPFNCHLPHKKNDTDPVATPEGSPDFHTWCGSPYEEAALECQQGDLSAYAKVIHKAQLDTPFLGKAIEVLDSHYCFAFGHCDNTEVTLETNLKDAEEMCDDKFGTGWRTVSKKELGISFSNLRPGLWGTHFSQQTEKAFAEMACAMGNYHCDVIYCRQEYCHNSNFVKRYERLRPANKK